MRARVCDIILSAAWAYSFIDARRTYPAYRQFASDEGKESLRNILHAYAALDPEVGYCQVLLLQAWPGMAIFDLMLLLHIVL